jgi:hypothetical protein
MERVVAWQYILVLAHIVLANSTVGILNVAIIKIHASRRSFILTLQVKSGRVDLVHGKIWVQHANVSQDLRHFSRIVFAYN